MKSGLRERRRYAVLARFFRRNKHRVLRVRRFEEMRESRRAAREAAGLPIRDSSPFSRFELAPQIRIDNFRSQIKILLKAFGHPEALVTDESLVRDMLRDGKKLVAIRRRMKIPIATNDYISSVAERLRAKGYDCAPLLSMDLGVPSAASPYLSFVGTSISFQWSIVIADGDNLMQVDV